MIPTATTLLDVDGRRFPLTHPLGHSIEDMLIEVFRKQVYPPLTFLANRIRVIFDIGANIGCATLWYKLHYPNAEIVAFEPDPNTFQCLQNNLRQFSNIKLHNFGFYSRECEAALYQGNNNTTTNSVCDSSHNTQAQVQVTLRKLSTFILDNHVDRISLLKLDTEGAEIPILVDLAPHMDKVEVIQLEYHSERDRREIDQLLASRFTLVSAQVTLPHRGAMTYVAEEIMSTYEQLHRLQIPRPRI